MAAACAQIASGQTIQRCSDYSESNVLSSIVPADTKEHIPGGLHAWGVTPFSSCIYTHGKSQTCDTECIMATAGSTSVDPIGGFTSIEKGALSVVGTHQVSGGWMPADNITIGGGVSCTGRVLAAAVNCFTVPGNSNACFVNVTLGAFGSVSINTNATQVWSSAPPVEVQTTCASEPDPENAPTPTPTPSCITSNSCSVPPCDPDNPPVIKFGNGQDGNAPNPCDSPIIIDLTGGGFALTDAAHGVLFDIANTGTPIQIAWTANANNAWLVLDRDGNGQINSGAEMFGNFTTQPSSPNPNGFNALKVYDDPVNGGNGDGVIDSRDQIFSKLRLWVDANHDGICQPGELHLLPDLGVYAISLDYTESKRTDQFGNVFRYSARINPGLSGNGSDVGKKAYDVFLMAQ